MKFLLPFVVAIVSVLSASFAGPLPHDVAELKAKRDAKVAEINRIYLAEMRKLKEQYSRKVNYAAAKAIEAEIASLSKDEAPADDDGIRSKLKGSSWKLDSSDKVLTFLPDGKASKSWGKLTPEWVVAGGKIIVEDSEFRFSPNGKYLLVKGGDKEGRWSQMD